MLSVAAIAVSTGLFARDLRFHDLNPRRPCRVVPSPQATTDNDGDHDDSRNDDDDDAVAGGRRAGGRAGAARRLNEAEVVGAAVRGPHGGAVRGVRWTPTPLGR